MGEGPGRDYLVLAYDAAGNLLWSTTYDGQYGLDDHATDVVVDPRPRITTLLTASSFVQHQLRQQRTTLDEVPCEVRARSHEGAGLSDPGAELAAVPVGVSMAVVVMAPRWSWWKAWFVLPTTP